MNTSLDVRSKLSSNLSKLPKYLFAEIDELKREVIEKGVDVIDLSIGDPDMPTPEPIVEALYEASKNPSNQKYPSYAGMIEFRKAVSEWFYRRFGVEFDPKNEIIALIGSKEGIAHIHWAFLEKGDVSLVPDPGYPVYNSATILAGATPYKMPLKEENKFFPKFEDIPGVVLSKAKMVFINYPNNPTSSTVGYEEFEKAVWFAKKNDIILCSDLAYSEIYEGDNKPISIFNVKGAKDVAIEFHSLSKTFNMTGWRVGFAVGNPEIIKGLLSIKSNVDSGVFNAIQIASIRALQPDMDKYIQQNRDIISRRKKKMISMLRNAGFNVYSSNATFYLWIKNPKSLTSKEVSMLFLKEAGIVVTPGNGFGEYGEGYFRISLTAPDERIDEAVERIKKLNLI
ncbi:MAG: LL-diaminopimelate aminotransferase [Spirochaetia bacterium]|nr:LL-diaminopimelate aminotransferase [Spirochaetota bacterium]MCX8096250.1 LL-diaminopimelate aminotransferase [Spirochaetota bacterium]MDW8112900.1 LL-diaminopimelate aminotransferase [Spirochaetia bacterium]